MAKKNSKRIDELRDTIRNYYRTPDALELMLSHYLRSSGKRRGRHGIFYCNQHKDENPSVTVNSTGTIRCGCFPCHIVCNNPIDVAVEFGGYSFEEAVVEAATILGLISSSEADDIMSGVETNPKQMRPRNVLPKPVVTTYDKQPYNFDKADIIYRLFSNLNYMSGTTRIKDTDLEDLTGKRKLSMPEIKKIGFFSFPTAPISLLIKELPKYGLSEKDLAYIPGFYYDIAKKEWDYARIKGEAYCIPIRNKSGKIVAIQIRLMGKDVTSRYIWFASTFAMYNDNEKVKTGRFGNSPGTPICVCYPDEIKTKALFITEGFYKAYEYTKNFGGIALSVQGVNNIEGIENLVDDLAVEYEITNIIIGFDADMAIKETVLKPSLKLGARLLRMEQPLYDKMELILSSNQKQEDTLTKNYKKEAAELEKYFATNTSKYKLHYAIWDLTYEKGFDDLIHSGNKDKVRTLPIATFWRRAFRILQEIDNYKFEESQSNCVKFNEIKLPERMGINLFNNIMAI